VVQPAALDAGLAAAAAGRAADLDPPAGRCGLTAEAEAWIRQIEDQLRIAESRLSGQLTRRSRPERAPGPDLWRLTARQVRLSRGLYPSDGNRRLATRRSLTSPE
jgi:hypothetical protein